MVYIIIIYYNNSLQYCKFCPSTAQTCIPYSKLKTERCGEKKHNIIPKEDFSVNEVAYLG